MPYRNFLLKCRVVCLSDFNHWGGCNHKKSIWEIALEKVVSFRIGFAFKILWLLKKWKTLYWQKNLLRNLETVQDILMYSCKHIQEGSDKNAKMCDYRSTAPAWTTPRSCSSTPTCCWSTGRTGGSSTALRLTPGHLRLAASDTRKLDLQLSVEIWTRLSPGRGPSL